MSVSIKELRDIFLDNKKRIRSRDGIKHFVEILRQSKFISYIDGNIFLDTVVNGLSKDELAKKYGESKVSRGDISARLIERLSGFVRLYQNNINTLQRKDQEIARLKHRYLLLEQSRHQELQEEEEKESIDSEILSVQINQLNLSNRPLKVLTSAAEVQTVGELLLLGRIKLLGYRNFGKKSQDELDLVMSQFGFAVENRNWVYFKQTNS